MNIPSNITVGSCECTMDYTGHLCSFIEDKKTEDDSVAVAILIACGIVACALLMALKIIRMNSMADMKDEYDAMRHQTQAFSMPAKKKEIKKADSDSDDDIIVNDDDDDEEESDEEDWPDDRDWRPKARKVIREDGLVKDGDKGHR